MARDREKARTRAARYRHRLHEAKYGPNAGDQRGKRQRRPSGPEHKNWGDGRRITSDGYVALRVGADHPLADANGWAYEHLVIWVSAGKPQPTPGFIIHHMDERKDHNRLSNLELKSKSQHSSDHIAERARDGSGRLLDGLLHDAMPSVQP